MKEEMNVDIPLNKAKLFGVYSDPQRDARRHTVSIVYELEIPEETIAQAGDDAVKVTKVHIDEIPNLDFFADHKTILNDYISQRRGATTLSNIDPIKRNVCLLSE
jgi:8-oxo-dGTP diphosphatase